MKTESEKGNLTTMNALQKIFPPIFLSLSIFMSSVTATGQVDDIEAAFKSYGFYRLLLPLDMKNIITKTTNVSNNIQCAFACVREKWCNSVNFRVATPKSTRLHKCELISIDVDTFPGALSKDERYIHFIKLSLDPCSKNPCLNGGVCKAVGKTENNYQCQCREGYDGQKCENEGLQTSNILRDHGNSSYLETLSSYLAPVLQNPSTSRWVRCWHAASGGWDVTTTFHPQCDGKGPTVTIVRVGKYVFGGYSDVSWHGSQSYSSSSRSFLYSLYNTNGYRPTKMELANVPNHEAIYGKNEFGPTFGSGYDMHIANQANSNENSYSLFSAYRPPQGCDNKVHCTVLAGDGEFRPNDVEVFYETTN